LLLQDVNTSALITKVLLPRRREDVLTRQRLLDRLYDMADRRLTLVSAPAGYGKTTLLVDFAHDLEHPVCWYALDRGDHDPRVFMEHLILSLHHRFPEFGDRTREALATTTSLGGGAPGVVNVLVNEMVETIPRWFALVLDDYHRLGEAPEVGAIISRLLMSQSDQFLVIVASRTVPELPLIIQLTARQDVGGIGQRDLSFRANEIQALLAQNYNLHIPAREAGELAEESEGWITSILLTAQTMWRDILDGLARARASDQPVFDYLAQEVFGHQEAEVQAFLTASSTLREMSPTLCQEALDLERPEHFLRLIEDRNLFVTRLEGEWYRYHHLFHEYLQQRLRSQEESRWLQLHRLAAGWFEAQGQPEEVVHHYLIAGSHAEAARVMEEAARDVFLAGHLETLMAWGEALPVAQREACPRLALFQSRAADMLGRWEDALALTEAAEHGYRASQNREGLAYALLHRCEVWRKRGQFQEACDLAGEVLSLVEEAGIPVAYEVQRMLGMTTMALGRLQEGEEHLRMALPLSLEQGSEFDQASILTGLAGNLWQQGRWAEALTAQREAVATHRRVGNQAALAGALNDLGFFHYTTCAHEEALHLFRQALELADRSGHRRAQALASISLAELLRDLGALEQAAEVCQAGVSIADDLGGGFLSAYGRETMGLIHRLQGDLAPARAAIEQAIERAEQQHSEYQLGRYGASLGLVLAEEGAGDAGIAELARAQERLQRIGAGGEVARARLFNAWALFQDGRRAEGLEALQELLGTAATSPWQEFLLVAEGQRMLPLLEHAQAQGIGGDQLVASLARAQTVRQAAQAALQLAPSPGTKPPEPVRIFGFGRGRVEREGQEIPVSQWGAASTRHLLFYLLVHSSQSREQIAAALWPELAQNKVKASFHTTKFRLKRALGQEPLYFDGARYHIHPDLQHWFDVAEFERLLKDTGPGRRVDRLQQAVALYQGDFLEDCYADWSLTVGEALRELCVDALEELANRLVARRQVRRAIETLRRGLTMDDLRETFHRQLMTAYALAGRRSDAIAQYQRCVELLEQELGTSPSPETTALHQRILDGLPLD
jgi:LuxR family maltose regulon positive regulatory protein